MSQYATSSDLEVLFIEKLQLKYKLTERDLRKAFSRYDKDSSGLLDIKEIGIAVRLMLNGVSDEQVRNLVSRFDLNGDGMISYDEFLQHLLKHKDGPTTAAVEADDARSDRRNWNCNTMYKSQFDDYNDHNRSRDTNQKESSSSTGRSQYHRRESGEDKRNYQQQNGSSAVKRPSEQQRENNTGRRLYHQESEGNTGRRGSNEQQRENNTGRRLYHEESVGNTGRRGSNEQQRENNTGRRLYHEEREGNTGSSEQQREGYTGRRLYHEEREGMIERDGYHGDSNFGKGDDDYGDDADSVLDNDENDSEEEEEEEEEVRDEFPSVNAELRGSVGNLPNSHQRYAERAGQRDYDNQSVASETHSDVASNFDPGNSSEVEYRCKVFLENLRSLLNKKVLDLRDKGALAHHLTLSGKELLEKTGCALLTKAFHKDTGGTRTHKEDQLIDFGNFVRYIPSVHLDILPALSLINVIFNIKSVFKLFVEFCENTSPLAFHLFEQRY